MRVTMELKWYAVAAFLRMYSPDSFQAAAGTQGRHSLRQESQMADRKVPPQTGKVKDTAPGRLVQLLALAAQ
jgi:hypothetical protein